jgi:hypothetical protein
MSVLFFSYSTVIQNIKNKTHRTIILPLVLFGFGTWPLTLEVVCRLRLFERRTFGSERDEVRRESRKLRNEELYDLQMNSPNFIRVNSSRRMR